MSWMPVFFQYSTKVAGDRVRFASARSCAVWSKRAAMVIAVSVALSGCMIGDEQPGTAQPIVGPWFNENCVPAECMFRCCQGWEYFKDPSLRGGEWVGPQCDKVRLKNPAYADYVALMSALWNKCSEEFRYLESGYCYDIEPPDVIKEFDANNQPVYLTSTFMVCPPKGQFAACPMQDVEIMPKADE